MANIPITISALRAQNSVNSHLTAIAMGLLIGTCGVSLKAYGAVGDGVADDTAAIVAAITAAKANGGSLYIPSGTYLTDKITSLASNLMIFGSGPEQSILKSRAGDTLIEVTGIDFTNVTLRDFGLTGNGGAGHGIYIHDMTSAANHLIYENLEIKNFVGNQIRHGAAAGGELNTVYSSTFKSLWLRGVGTGDSLFYASRSAPTNTYQDIMIWEVPNNKYGFEIAGWGTFIGCNGVVTNSSAGTGRYALFTGGVGGHIVMIGCNIESFTGTAIDTTVGMHCLNCEWIADSAGTDHVAIISRTDSEHPVICDGCRFVPENGYDAQTPWSHGYPLHFSGNGRFLIRGGTPITNVWSIDDGYSFVLSRESNSINLLGPPGNYAMSRKISQAHIQANLITWAASDDSSFLTTLRPANSNGDVLANSAHGDTILLLPTGRACRFGITVDNASWTESLVVNANGTITPPLLTADPSGAEGQMYYNTTSHVLKVHNGTAWKTVTMT